ncbi:MAG: flagellar biosynthetic protein FliR [Clostridiales bacterium]|nr:flagellar biosynthetic protein FliR [Clostridiales bacterium]
MLGNNIEQMTLFSLIFMRMSGFILFNPILGRRNISMTVKGGFIFILTLAVYSFSSGNISGAALNSPFTLLIAYLKEFAVGYVLGFAVQLFIFIVNYGGYINDFQMGLSMATVYDSQSNAQMPLSGRIFETYMLLLFFAVDGHIALMHILLTSYTAVPYGDILFSDQLVPAILDIFKECIILGVKFAMPMMIILFLVEIGVGLLMKIVPQINIFVLNIQMKVIFGLVILLLLFSPLKDYMNQVINTMLTTLEQILHFL